MRWYICGNCGNWLTEDEIYCFFCGTFKGINTHYDTEYTETVEKYVNSLKPDKIHYSIVGSASFIAVVSTAVLGWLAIVPAIGAATAAFIAYNEYDKVKVKKVIKEMHKRGATSLKNIQNKVNENLTEIDFKIEENWKNQALVINEVSDESNKNRTLQFLSEGLNTLQSIKSKYLIKASEIEILRIQNKFRYLASIENKTEKDFDDKIKQIKELISEVEVIEEKLQEYRSQRVLELDTMQNETQENESALVLTHNLYDTHLTHLSNFIKTCNKLREYLVLKKAAVSLKDISLLDNNKTFEYFVKSSEDIEVQDTLLDIDATVKAINEIENEFARLEAEKYVIEKHLGN